MKRIHLLAGTLILFLVCVFFWQVFIKGYVPFPGDLLVGAYYPWLEYKWGTVTGVPVQNGLISDVFSQTYVWKHLAVESLRSGEWPLWNPYVYSGYPLLANFSGGSLYLFNFLLLWGASGWSLLLIFQVLVSGLAVYYFLALKKFSLVPSLAGAILYAFSASMMIRLEENTAGHVLAWMPVCLLLIESFFAGYRYYILLLPLTTFLLITAGHFQTMFYSMVILSAYLFYKFISGKDLRRLIVPVSLFAIGILMSAVQILPTYSMFRSSIRISEHAITRDNFGLLPLRNLVTLLAPDYYGNPVTGNYWGFLNYSETIFYPGVIGLVAFLWALFNFRKLKSFTKFAFILGSAALVLAFDNPISRLIYELKIPFISTGYAGRIAVIFMFSAASLIPQWLTDLSHMKKKEAMTPVLIMLSVLLMAALLPIYTPGLFQPANVVVALRNLAFPALLSVTLLVLIIFRKNRHVLSLILVLLIADQFRFGWKYNPFVPKEFVFPQTALTEFLNRQPGLFRIVTQNKPILPAQTWAVYGLYSPSGYDPLIGQEYVQEYSRQLNSSTDVSRYSILDRYDPEALGEFNVLFLIAEKSSKPEDMIPFKGWQNVFETDKLVVYKNPLFKERVSWEKDGQGSLELTSYRSNSLSLNYSSGDGGTVIIRDSWDEGWIAYVNGSEVPVDKYRQVFRSIELPKGSGKVEMRYRPDSWASGTKSFLFGLSLWLVTCAYIIKRKKYAQN